MKGTTNQIIHMVKNSETLRKNGGVKNVKKMDNSRLRDTCTRIAAECDLSPQQVKEALERA